jgi:release factor glutamine methyltransferase
VTRGELITELAALLGERHEARFIVEDVLGAAPSPPGGDVDAAALDAALAMAARRRAGEPLQYVLGHWAFRALDLLVDENVLIPRPETEQVVDVALHEFERSGTVAPRIVDAGTGSGAIALALATELADRHPRGHVWATDASAAALMVAQANLDRVTDQCAGAILPVTFALGSWLSPLPGELAGTIDLIVSNPPYVAKAEWSHLPAEVRREPVAALVAADGSDGTPGLRDVEDVLSTAWAWLTRHGSVVIEIAPAQAEPAAAMARSVGYRHVRVETDMAQRPRALVGRTR